MKEVPLNYGEDSIIPIGKYKGQDITQIYSDDPAYFQWMYESVELDNYPGFFNTLEGLLIQGI